MRGGTSKGVFFHEHDLPADGDALDRLLLSMFGSPDPFGRQLNGMGGGISSTSKVIIVRRSTRADADIDYLHGQVSVDRPSVDWSANCGNLSAAIGPFALAEGLVFARGGAEAVVRLHNLNTGALIHARFPVIDGAYCPDGEFVMPGVGGTGARIALEYLRPGAPDDGVLFPSGKPAETVVLSDRDIEITASYAALPVAWVRAEDVGLDPTLLPDAIDANRGLAALLEDIRREAAVRMGLAATPVSANLAAPKLGIVARPQSYVTLSGETVAEGDADVLVRMISMERAHKASPLTGAMCLAATCLAPGTVPHSVCRTGAGPEIRIATPSGVLTVGAVLDLSGAVPKPDRTITYATARRLMDGWVYGRG